MSFEATPDQLAALAQRTRELEEEVRALTRRNHELREELKQRAANKSDRAAALRARIAELDARLKTQLQRRLREQEMARRRSEVSRESIERLRARIDSLQQARVAARQRTEAEAKVGVHRPSAPPGPPVLELRDVGLRYSLAVAGGRRWGRRRRADFWPIRHVSLTVREGEIIAVIGANGAGKSTLLRVAAGILTPDEGSFEAHRRISPLLTLGAGFRPDLSGRENLMLGGLVAGVDESLIRERADEIIRFAELEQFIDQPIRSYSSGMQARLGFAVAVHLDPEILVVDEVLGVGDVAFRERAEQQMNALMGRASAILIATHSMPLVRRLCSRAFWIDGGRVRAEGDPEEVTGAYLHHRRGGGSEQTANPATDTDRPPHAG